ncbi:MAG: hypothetical protein ABIR25_04780, partial [Sphingomicrobium sp.]
VIFSCKSNPGRIVLGGPQAGGSSGIRSMYVVAFGPESAGEKLCSTDVTVTPTNTDKPTETSTPSPTAKHDDREVHRDREPIVCRHMLVEPAHHHGYSPFDALLTNFGDAAHVNKRETQWPLPIR